MFRQAPEEVRVTQLQNEIYKQIFQTDLNKLNEVTLTALREKLKDLLELLPADTIIKAFQFGKKDYADRVSIFTFPEIWRSFKATVRQPKNINEENKLSVLKNFLSSTSNGNDSYSYNYKVLIYLLNRRNNSDHKIPEAEFVVKLFKETLDKLDSPNVFELQ